MWCDPSEGPPGNGWLARHPRQDPPSLADDKLPPPYLFPPQLEREFKIVLQLGAASVAAFGLVAILFFWAKWGQALHHSDPVRMGTPLTPGGIGGQQHHWASSFAHGEHINAVRNLPTALFLTCVILTFLYIMYLVQLYLSSKVFHIPKQHLVRGVWGGRGHARPAEFMSRARRLSDEPGAVGTTHRSAPRHTTAHCTARGGPPQQLEQWRAQGHRNGGGAQGPGRYGDWHQAWAGWKPGRTDGYAKLDPSPEPALRPFRNDRWSINSLDKTSVMSDPPSFRSSSPPALGVPPSILHALSTGLASCLGGAAPGARLSEPAAAVHGRGGSVASRESRAE